MTSIKKELQVKRFAEMTTRKQFNTRIGIILRRHRHLKGWSQSKVAELLDVSFQQVQKYENGNNNLCPFRIAQCAEIFGSQIWDEIKAIKGGDDSIEQSKPFLSVIRLFQVLDENQRQAILKLMHSMTGGTHD